MSVKRLIIKNGLYARERPKEQMENTCIASVVEIFTDLNVWMGIRKVIESINDNAKAA